METIQRGDQLIRYDKTRTMRAYAALLHGGCEDCGCSSCLNFAAQRDKAYPEEFRALLASLGIDPSKEGEVYECGPAGDLYLYGGWFYFSGNVLEAGERLSKADGGSSTISLMQAICPSRPPTSGMTLLLLSSMRESLGCSHKNRDS